MPNVKPCRKIKSENTVVVHCNCTRVRQVLNHWFLLGDNTFFSKVKVVEKFNLSILLLTLNIFIVFSFAIVMKKAKYLNN